MLSIRNVAASVSTDEDIKKLMESSTLATVCSYELFNSLDCAQLFRYLAEAHVVAMQISDTKLKCSTGSRESY